MGVLDFPNLPRRRVTLAAVNADAVDTIDWMERRGIRVIPVLPDSRLPDPVRSHADMLLHHLGGDRFVCAVQEEATRQRLKQEGFSLISMQSPLGNRYPQDIRLNALRLGNLLVGKLSALEPALVEESRRRGIRMVDCAQGYARCACAVLTEHAVATAESLPCPDSYGKRRRGIGDLPGVCLPSRVCLWIFGRMLRVNRPGYPPLCWRFGQPSGWQGDPRLCRHAWR